MKVSKLYSIIVSSFLILCILKDSSALNTKCVYSHQYKRNVCTEQCWLGYGAESANYNCAKAAKKYSKTPEKDNTVCNSTAKANTYGTCVKPSMIDADLDLYQDDNEGSSAFDLLIAFCAGAGFAAALGYFNKKKIVN